MRNKSSLIVNMLEAGTLGYLVKNVSKQGIFEAITEVISGSHITAV